MTAIIIAVASLVAAGGLGVCCYRLRASRNALQQNLSVVESTLAGYGDALKACQDRLKQVEEQQQEELTQEQVDYRDKMQAQYASLYQQIRDNVAKELKNIRDGVKDDIKDTLADAAKIVTKNKVDFEKLLKAEFEKACAEIKFGEIEYKKTITKKRKEHSRKNGKNAKPQRVWRYIDEE